MRPAIRSGPLPGTIGGHHGVFLADGAGRVLGWRPWVWLWDRLRGHQLPDGPREWLRRRPAGPTGPDADAVWRVAQRTVRLTA